VLHRPVRPGIAGRASFIAECLLAIAGRAACWTSGNRLVELAILSEHVLAVDGLPPIHKEPFDRLLLAQATSEGITADC
jgi:hypothetical protein